MTKIRASAKGEDCALQIHPYCTGSPETVVLCHLPGITKGLALKSPEHWSAYGCHACHDIIDSRNPQAARHLGWQEIERCMWRGLFRTQQRLIEKGLMVLP